MKRISIYKIIIALVVIAFQVFSFASNREALLMIWGEANKGDLWASLLAFGVVAIDFAGVKFLLGGLRSVFDGEPGVEWGWVTLGVCWLATVAGDTWLSYFAIANTMIFRTNHILIQSGVLSFEAFTRTFPIFAALMILGVQILLGIRSETIFDSESFVPRSRGNNVNA